MVTAGARRHPDFPCRRVAVDDDLATVGEFQFQDAAGFDFQVHVGAGRLDGVLDAAKHRVRQGVEFAFFHIKPVLTSAG